MSLRLLVNAPACSLGHTKLRAPRLLQPAACRATSAAYPGQEGYGSAHDGGRASAAHPEGKAQAQSGDVPGQAARRGRPPGHAAWNKGVPMSQDSRDKLSRKMKQKWKDPDYRRSVCEGNQNNEIWNAGRTLSPDTRAKMSDAKQGKPLPLATRRRMSEAKAGHAVSTDVRAAVSAAQRGKPKSEEHRLKVAASQRRRHAATRVLHAVEAVYSAASAPAAGGPSPASAGASQPAAGSALGPRGPGQPGSGGVAPAAAGAAAPSPALRAAAYSMGLTGLSDSRTGKRLSRTQILNTFKAELREYRALQEELSTWTAAFREKAGRKPNLVDVQRTGIPWLIDRFKQYVVLRDRLFSDTSVLRGKLSESIPDPDSVRHANATNANGPASGTRSAAASRYAAVMEYKNRGGGAAAAAASAAGDAVGAAEAQLAAKVSGMQVPPRVKLAMQSAIEYRQQKAQATKAAAVAAADAARAGSPSAAAAAAASSTAAAAARPAPVPVQQPEPAEGMADEASAAVVAAAALT